MTRALAVDYGGRRTGLAVSDAVGITALPLDSINSTDLQETVDGVVRVAIEKEATVVLLGMPYMPDGREGEQAARVRLFASELKKGLPKGTKIIFKDERYTTKAASSLWRQAGIRGKQAKPFLDSTAAVVLLREYLEETPI